MNPLQELLKKKLAEPTTKRQYFRNNQKTVIELLDAGATHAEILQAFELDGVTMSARYFSRLLNDASPKERPAKPVESKSHRAGLGASPEPKKTNAVSGLSPEKQAVKDELDRIRDDNSLTLAQKREAAAKATASLVNKNPLAGRK